MCSCYLRVCVCNCVSVCFCFCARVCACMLFHTVQGVGVVAFVRLLVRTFGHMSVSKFDSLSVSLLASKSFSFATNSTVAFRGPQVRKCATRVEPTDALLRSSTKGKILAKWVTQRLFFVLPNCLGFFFFGARQMGGNHLCVLPEFDFCRRRRSKDFIRRPFFRVFLLMEH